MGSDGKEPILQGRRPRFDPWVRKISLNSSTQKPWFLGPIARKINEDKERQNRENTSRERWARPKEAKAPEV